MRYRVTHTTTYSSSEAISVGHNEAWLRPREMPSQLCPHYELKIEPEPSIRSTRRDYFGNTVSQFSFNQGYRELIVTSVCEVALRPQAVNSQSASPAWEPIAALLRDRPTAESLQAYEFVFDSPRVRRSEILQNYALPSFPNQRPIVDGLTDLLGRFRQDFKFDATATNVWTPLEVAFKQRRGVCQDFAHMMIGMLRSLGLAARYVSGYLRTYPPAGKPRLVGADASHAWVSVYCGALGWVDVDPTNNAFPNLEHITVAWGRDYTDVVPIKGVVIGGGSQSSMNVGVDVLPLDEEPSETDSDKKEAPEIIGSF